MTTTTDLATAQTEMLLRAYADAWNRHDVDGILSMQAGEMVFHLHLDGFEEVSGRAAQRQLFRFFFQAMPDYRAEVARRSVRGSLVTLEYTITTTLAEPFPIGAQVGLPSGRAMRFSALDVIRCGGGRVTRKDTFVDEAALRAGLGL